MVVGAGLAGLATAFRLHQAGLEVLVVEAGDRVGGRLHTAQVGGVTVDAGGSWLGPGQAAVLSLVQELGLTVVPQYDSGANLLRLAGRVHRYRGDVPRLGPVALLDIGRAYRGLDAMARRLGPPQWAGTFAQQLDAETLADWMHRRVRTSAGRLVLTALTAASFGCRPEELSLLAFAAHVHSAGGLTALTGVRDALAMRVAEGAAAIPARLAARLTGRVVLGQPVTRIRRGADGVTVECSPGSRGSAQRLQARQVVIAVDPTAAAAIDHEPSLPTSRRHLQQHWVMGSGIKAHIAYAEPWWRNRGLSGAAVSDTGVARVVFDVSPPRDGDGRPGPGILMTFLGRAAIDDPHLLRPDRADHRRERVVQDLVALFGPCAGAVLDYTEQDWSREPWVGGCVPCVPPGLLATHQEWLTRPIGPLHWAGAETSSVWEGHMEGAVRSAERASGEILGLWNTPRGDLPV